MGILSINRSMSEMDDLRLRGEALLDAYRSVLLALKRASAVIAGEESKPFQDRLESVRSQLSIETPPQTLRQGREAIEGELDGFARQRARFRDQIESEYKQIIRMVAEAGAVLARNGSTHSQELLKLADGIASVSRLENIAQVRHQLSDRVAEIKIMAAKAEDDGNSRARELEAKIRKVEERLKVAEKLAESDALTGLGNRRMAETAIASAIASGAPFSLVLCDLDGFKSINDSYGHRQGDRLLKSVARGLTNAVRESDVVCRWGGDEFVILFKNTSLSGARARGAAIEKEAFGEFLLDHSGSEARVHITASIGAAQYRTGETAPEFFERLDRLMYAKKGPRGPAVV